MRPRATRRRRAQEAAGDCGEGDDWLATDGDGLADAEKGATGDVVSVQDVREWLRRVGFSEYEPAFVANDINGAVLKTLTSEELRDDLQVTNLRHRRDLGLAIQRLIAATTPATVDALPEHGRILDHLSNIRTVHSWMRLGVQMLAFSVVTLQLSPNFRATAIVTAASFYFALVGVAALVYGILRYKAVIKMIEQSGASTPKFNPDRSGVVVILILVLIASGVALTLILLRGV